MEPRTERLPSVPPPQAWRRVGVGHGPAGPELGVAALDRQLPAAPGAVRPRQPSLVRQPGGLLAPSSLRLQSARGGVLLLVGAQAGLRAAGAQSAQQHPQLAAVHHAHQRVCLRPSVRHRLLCE